MPGRGRAGGWEVGARLRAASAHRAAEQGRASGPGTRYTLKQHTLSRDGEFFIRDERGDVVYHVDWGPSRRRESLSLEDASGHELYRAAAPAGAETMDIRRPDGSVAAVVHNALLSPVRDRWWIELPEEEGMVAAGSILQHEYILSRGGRTVASVSKTWHRRRDAYGVAVADDAEVPLALAVTVAIDVMSHRGEGVAPPQPAAGRG